MTSSVKSRLTAATRGSAPDLSPRKAREGPGKMPFVMG